VIGIQTLDKFFHPRPQRPTIRRRGVPRILRAAPKPKQLDHVLHTTPTRIGWIDEIGAEGLFVGETLDKINSNPI
jgi:hypothetical protein